ncbi:MAG: sugar ABC transporter permease [Chloroflexota bacterium]|nr:sugar ABC transporter permease [Chloroflexota bacterium]
MRSSRKAFPWHIIVFLAPAVIIYTLFMIYPLIDSLRLSLYTTETQGGPEIFVGLQNYQRLFTDQNWQPRVTGALINTFEFFAIHMLVQNPLALLLATLLSSRFIALRSVYRTLIFLPSVLSVVLIGFIWQLIFSPVFGRALWAQIGIRLPPLLGEPETALPVLGLVSVWQWVGVPMMLFLAALISIPDELIEAARVDGATAWSVFWRVKLPLIMPTVGIVTVLTFVGNFNAFDLIYTTQGALAAPDYSTDLLGTLFYRTFFGFQLQLGNPTMGAAVAGVMFLIILAGVLLYLFTWQRRLLRNTVEM